MSMEIDEIREELKKLKDEKYHLLKLINHDVRSPFNRIFALLQLFEMESEELSDNQKQYIDSMYLSILSSLEMIQNLKDMRDIDAQKINIEIHESNLQNIVENSIKSLSKQIELKKISLNQRVPSNINIKTDDFYLERVITNLLSNAIKFSSEGSKVWIEVSQDNDLIHVDISDHGSGIKQDEIRLLFQKYKKLSSVATGGESSLGLGLFNAKFFASQLNADIAFIPGAKHGAKFRLSLDDPSS